MEAGFASECSADEQSHILQRLPTRLRAGHHDELCFFLQTDDSNGDLDPGVLLTAQTITSETTSSTTTTQITKVTDQ